MTDTTEYQAALGRYRTANKAADAARAKWNESLGTSPLGSGPPAVDMSWQALTELDAAVKAETEARDALRTFF
jgi:hypothetical protein